MTVVSDYRAIIGTTANGSSITFNGATIGIGAVVTYSFETTPVLDTSYPAAFLQSFQNFSAQQVALTRQALDMWSSVSGLVFVEVPGNLGEMRFGNYDFNLHPTYAGYGGFASYPSRTTSPVLNYPSAYELPESSDVFINTNRSETQLQLYLHEIGHAIGLDHTFEGTYTLPTEIDNYAYSVMSYTGSGRSVTGLGTLDFDAVRYLYGNSSADPTNYSYNASTLTFTWFETEGADVQRGTSVRDVIDGRGGNDQIYGYSGDDLLTGGAGDDFIVGGSGNDWIRPGAGNDSVEGRAYSSAPATGEVNTVDYADAINAIVLNLASWSYDSASTRYYHARGADIGLDSLVGISNVLTGAGNDSVTGDAQANLLTTGAGSDIIQGLGGNDVILPGAGNDSVVGGDGFDTVILTGVRRGHAFSGNGTALTVSSAADGTDTIREVESVRFVDGELSFDPAGLGAQVYRMYDATLGRAAEPAGLDHWADYLGGGHSLLELAGQFMQSREFQARYGAPSNDGYVELLYNNTLHRASDASGKAYWTSWLNSHSRGELVVQFSESTEHQLQTASAVNAGLWLEDDLTSAVARMYDASFGRRPDEGGLTSWRNALDNGSTLLDLAGSFASSTEFRATYGALDNRGFVTTMYRNTLDRDGEASGVNAWTSYLDSHSRADVLLQFSESAEHQALMGRFIDGGILLA